MSNPPQEHFRRLERMYHSAPVNDVIPSRLVVSEGQAEVLLTVGKQFWHSGHGLHGSMYFKGLDDAAFFAASSVTPDFFVLTARFEVELLAVVTCETLRALGRFERKDGRKIWASSELFDEAGSLVGRGTGLFVVGKTPLTEATGYER